MSLPLDSQPLTKHLFTVRVIVASLFAGIVVGLIAVVQGVQPPVNPVKLFLFDPVAMWLHAPRCVVCCGVSYPRRWTARRGGKSCKRSRHAAETWDALMRQRVARLLNGHLTRTIVTAATIEVAGDAGNRRIIRLVATKVGLAAALVGAGLIITLYPTRSGLENWLQSQFRLLDEATAKSQQPLAR